MAAFWIFSNFLREKCDENVETKKLCQLIATKFMEGEKKELRAQSAREENITLKLDVGNLELLCYTAIENDHIQAELECLLKQYYEEHLRATFDIDECQIEKLYSYEEIKIELETRESVNGYQQFYWRKIKMATKMEERKIVNKYRHKEREFQRTENERLKLEESLEKLKQEAAEFRVKVQEMHECIYRLVKGSKELEMVYSYQKPSKIGLHHKSLLSPKKSHLMGANESNKSSHQILQKCGLSSRLLLDFNQFKTPSVPYLPKIRTINPTKGLSRLLEQAEVFRKSMQESCFISKNDSSTPKLPSILKTPADSVKPPESFHKTVSFEADLPQIITSSNDSININPTIPHITLDTTISEDTVDPDLNKNPCESTKAGPEKPNIEIIENIVIKPAIESVSVQLPKESHSDLLCDSKTLMKRKIIHDDHNYASNSSPKKKHNDCDIEKLDPSIDIGSKSFMDMFLDFSKDASTTSDSIGVSKKEVIPDIEKDLNLSEKPTQDKKEIHNEFKVDNKKKIGKSKASFDDFEDFFSGFAGGGSDNNDNDQSEAEMSFDFFEGKENTDGGGSDNISFIF